MSSHVAETPLKSLNEELKSALQHVQMGLEAYLEDPAETASLSEVAERVEQMHGVLVMLDRTAAATLAEEVAAVARHLLAGSELTDRAGDALLRAVLHLEWLQHGGDEQYCDLDPLLDDLRSLRAAQAGAGGSGSGSARALQILAGQLRPQFQRALLGLLRGKRVEQNLDLVATTLAPFKQQASDESTYRFWWLAEGLVAELINGTIPIGPEMHVILRDLDHHIKHLNDSPDGDGAESGANALAERVGERLSTSPAGLHRLEQRIDYDPPRGTFDPEVRAPAIGLGLPNIETLQQLSANLREHLALVRDAVDRYTRSATRNPEVVLGEMERLHELANILAMLNMDVPARLVARQMRVLDSRLPGDGLSDGELFELATELTLVEDSLDGLQEFAYNRALAQSDPDAIGDIGLLTDVARQRARVETARESANAMGQARELVAGRVDGECKEPVWQGLAVILHEVGCALAMLECDLVAAVFERLEHSIGRLVNHGRQVDDLPIIRELAEVLVALEFYACRLGDSQLPDNDLLEQVSRQLDALEVLVQEILHATQAGPVEESGVETALGGVAAEARQSDGTASTADSSMDGESVAESTTADATDSFNVQREPDASVHDLDAEFESILAGAEDVHSSQICDTDGVVPERPVADEVDSEFVEVFIEEASSELASIGGQLKIWKRDLRDQEALTSIRRSFHTLKGSGRMVGATTIGELAWSIEALLNCVIDGSVAASCEILAVVQDARAQIAVLVDEGAVSVELSPRVQALRARADALVRGDSTLEEGAASGSDPILSSSPEAGSQESGDLTQPVTGIGPDADDAALMIPVIVDNTPITPETPNPVKGRAVDQELVEVFLYESAEILDASDGTLQRWSADPDNGDLLNDLRREMHTLKGSSRMAGYGAVGNLAHAMESLLDALATNAQEVSEAVPSILQRTLDTLNEMLACVRAGEPLPAADGLMQEIHELLGVPVSSTAVAAPDVAADSRPEVTDREAPAASLVEYNQELVEVFLYEAAEILDASDGTLQRWRAEPENDILLNDLRREMHTLKGSSRMAGFSKIGDLAHAVESLLDALAGGDVDASERVPAILQRTLDALNSMLARAQDGQPISAAPDLIRDINDVLGVASSADDAPPRQAQSPQQQDEAPAAPAPSTASAPSADTIRVSAQLLNSLVNQMGESNIYSARIDQGVGGLRFNLGELDQTVFRLRQQLRRLEIETEAQILSRYKESSGDHRQDFDPLELDRFSELHQLSRSLMEIVDDLVNIQGSMGDQAQDMGFLLDQQGKINKDIQQGLMRTRMVPFNSVVPRLRRVVRQSCQEVGKQAELVLVGAESEIDRTILESMVAPLEHVLRNSVSHGIETPVQRRACNKPESGTITLGLRREGAEVVLTLRDDGAGLDFDAIRAKGEAKGMLAAGQPVTEQELTGLLLRPGFSTAAQVTQLSGRGVGMDVLNEAITEMRGALQIQSQRGQGILFTIRLPFSLAVTQALLVRAGGGVYAVPLLSIEAVSRLHEGDMQAYLAGKRVEHVYGDQRFPMHGLGILFGGEAPQSDAAEPRAPVLLFRSADASAALQVDAVLGSQEIIVKPVGPQLAAVPGVSGATVLGDGRVILVLDLATLVRNMSSRSQQQSEARALQDARQEVAPDRLNAMVIDDSITMRKVTGRFLERHGMSVTVAKDGVDAVGLLEERVPDLVILDIEMPRMDGFEVVAHIRNRPHLKHLPIIMVTSRSGEKHRERAAKLGVNDYLVKPYQEQALMSSIHQVLGDKAEILAT